MGTKGVRKSGHQKIRMKDIRVSEDQGIKESGNQMTSVFCGWRHLTFVPLSNFVRLETIAILSAAQSEIKAYFVHAALEKTIIKSEGRF